MQVKKLIVNADDAGLDITVNDAIIKAHTNGILTSTTVVASGRAFLDAVSRFSQYKKLGVGVHLTLVGERGLIRSSLTDENGYLPKNYAVFILNYLQGKYQKGDIEAEIEAQIAKCVKEFVPTHIDSHQHLLAFVPVMQLALPIIERYGITKIRNTVESPYVFGGWGRWLGKMGLGMLGRISNSIGSLSKPEHFHGMMTGGHNDETSLLKIIGGLGAGTNELMIHPGTQDLSHLYDWEYHWESEYQALISPKVKELIQSENISLINYAAL